MSRPPNWSPRKGSKAALFLELAKPNREGFSRVVSVKEFIGRYEGLRFGNGGSWVRQDGALAGRYNIRIHKKRNAISAVELQGYKKVEIKKPIPTSIRKQFKDKRCAVLDIGKIEIDHKDGRLDDPRLNDSSRVTADDFQALSKPANNAKRAHCKKCRETNQRYDAKRLGFPIAQYAGDEMYNGTCIGCYWHDPKRFIETVCEQLRRQPPGEH